MKLLPTGRKSVFYLTVYGSVVSALLLYYSILRNSFLFCLILCAWKLSCLLSAWSRVSPVTSVFNVCQFNSCQLWTEWRDAQPCKSYQFVYATNYLFSYYNQLLAVWNLLWLKIFTSPFYSYPFTAEWSILVVYYLNWN